MDAQEIEFRRQHLLKVLESDDPLTLKALHALPADRMDWKPDVEKCMTAGALGAHSVLACEFFLGVVDGQPPPDKPPAAPPTKDALLAAVEGAMANYRSRIASATPEFLAREVDFFGTKYPAIEILSWHPAHMTHHRGQFVLYLRLMGAHVPATYGPSGDEDFDATLGLEQV